MRGGRQIIIASLTVLVLCVSVFWSVPAAQAAAQPADIAGRTDLTQIQYLIDRGIVSGYPDGTFRPDQPINRAEFITMINRAFRLNETAAIQFTDLTAGDWYYGEVAKAVRAGYLTGFPDGTVGIERLMTRQEAAVVVARLLSLDTADISTLFFTDSATIPVWSRGAINTVVQHDLMDLNSDGTFRPLATLSRGETAVLIYRCLQAKVAVTGVTLTPSSQELYRGESIVLQTVVEPVEASDPKLKWISSNPAVASVDERGRVSGLRAGTATITATTLDGGFTDSSIITVKESIPVRGVSLDKSSVTVAVGRTVTLSGTFVPDNATNQNVAWNSSDATIARVDDAGRVTGMSPGSAVITVKTQDGGFTGTCKVYVNEDAYLILNGSFFAIYLDRPNRNLYARLHEDESDVLGVIWESDDTDVAVINYEPRSLVATVTAQKRGTCRISVEVLTQEGEYRDSATIKVLER